MALVDRMGRAVRWLAGAGTFLLPACTALDGPPPAGLPPPPKPVTRANPGPLPVIGAAARTKPGDGASDVVPAAAAATPALPAVPAVGTEARPLPINLPSALQLSDARPVDVAAAAERVRVAAAQLDQARVLWLPTITLGADYNRHDGKIQNADGTITDASRSSVMFGAGSGIANAAIISVNDAVFAPLVARQTVRARMADQRAAQNDTVVAVTDAYFTVQQARGELAGAIEATRRTEDLVRRTRQLAPGLVPDLEATRAETELARRQQVEEFARERWRVAGAELLRVLRLDPTAQVEPVEPPDLRVDLIAPDRSVDELIPIALTNRPELASRQAQVQATLALLKQEKLRPLMPSILIRGWSTPVTGTLAAGVFAGGTNAAIGNTGLRGDIDAQLLWQFDNFGLGNRARTHQREAENKLAIVELFRVQDQVAADVSQAEARSRHAARRVELAAKEVRLAVESADKNLVALGQLRRVGEVNQLVVRPQEAVAAVQALAQAYSDYFTAVADHNRAQFQLYRALGHPASCLSNVSTPPANLPGTNVPATLPAPAPATNSGPGVIPSAHVSPTGRASQPTPEWRPAPGGPRVGKPVPVSVYPVPAVQPSVKPN
ncbi:MAG: hypothetical protein JWO38_1543 [Gemmataceae bacterium]|nr:hypothetical protein [Gemmataceae bacterium]